MYMIQGMMYKVKILLNKLYLWKGAIFMLENIHLTVAFYI